MSSFRTEGERRLRSIVRAFVSPAVWLAVMLQWVIAVLRWIPLPQAMPGSAALRAVITAGLLILFFYVTVGSFRALAQTREAVSLRLAFKAARDVVAPFLWLVVKAVFLLLAVTFAAVLVLSIAWTDRVEPIAPAHASVFVTVTSGVLGYVFVYWLPWVFVHEDLRLLVSLRAALRSFWKRLPQSAFVAVLTLGPTAIAVALPDETPLILVLSFSWIGLFAAWIAFIYCAEWLQDNRSPATR